jgi:hypothetical protein
MNRKDFKHLAAFVHFGRWRERLASGLAAGELAACAHHLEEVVRLAEVAGEGPGVLALSVLLLEQQQVSSRGKLLFSGHEIVMLQLD